MAIIKYTSKGMHTQTPCPYGEKFYGNLIFVASWHCCQCKYFERQDSDKHTVKCKQREA